MSNKCILWDVITIISMFCMCFALLIGCGGSEMDDDDPIADGDLISDNLPNLDDPKMREQILMEAIDEDNLQTRQSSSGEELFYAPNQEEPYTGWVKSQQEEDDNLLWYNELWQVQDGKKHGIYLKWYSNQQNEVKGFFKDSAKDGKWTYWYENGQKKSEGFFKDSAEDGFWTIWTENGEKHNMLIHEGVFSVGFSPDGKTLASGSWQATIGLWDVATGTLKHRLRGHGVMSIA